MGRREYVVVILVALRMAALVFLLGRLPPIVDGHYVANDALRFQQIAVSPGTPYRDFEVEVPPVEYFALRAVHGSDPRATAVDLAWLQFVMDLALVCALILGWGSRAAIAYLILSAPLVPFLYFRLDLIPMALAVLGFALARRRAPVAGGIVLGLAVLAKIWPLALFPVLAIERRWRALLAATAATAAGLAAWLAWVGVDGLRQVATFRGAHGWQIESVVGTLVLILTAKPVVYDGGALRVGEATAAARGALTGAFVLFAAAATLLGWRRREDTATGGALAVTIVAVLLLFAPILSWQYVAWLLPWAAIATADGDWTLGGLTLAVAALTAWMIFLSLPLSDRGRTAEIVVSARDAFLVAIATLGCIRLAIGRRNAGRWETGSHEPEPAGV